MIIGFRLVKDPIGTGERKHIGENMDECVLYPLRWSTNRVEMSRWAMIWQIRKLGQDHVFVLFFIMWELQYLKCMHVPRGPGDVSLLACWCWLLDFSRRFCQPPGLRDSQVERVDVRWIHRSSAFFAPAAQPLERMQRRKAPSGRSGAQLGGFKSKDGGRRGHWR